MVGHKNDIIMALQDELKKLEVMLPGGLTPEAAELINKIKSEYTTPADVEELDRFVHEHLMSVKEDVLQLQRDVIKLQMGELPKLINLSYLAKKYFRKSQSWLSQRLNGCTVNGKVSRLTPDELETLNHALQDISKEIGSYRLSY